MKANSIKKKIEQNFNPIFLLAIVIGLFTPGLKVIPSSFATYLLALIIFLSVSKIDKKDMEYINIKEIIIFYILRFIVFPVLIFLISKEFLPNIANGILLLCLTPAGVSTAALANIMGGSISLGLSITALSTLLSPIVIPLAFEYLTISTIKINTISMFLTLLFLIFVPLILSRVISKFFKKQNEIVKENASWLSVILIAILPIIILGKHQKEFFEDPLFSIKAMMVLSILFFLYYITPWFILRKKELKKKISFTLSSGTNNSALAAVLGVLYLSPANIIFLVLSEVIWTLALIPFKRFIDRK